MDRSRTRRFVVLMSLSAVSILLATTSVAAPAGRPEAGPSNANQPVVNKKASAKRAPPARNAGSRRGQPKVSGSKSAKGRPASPPRTAKPRGRAAPSAPKTRPPARRSPPPRQTAPPPRGIQPKHTTPRTTPRLWERRHQRDVPKTPAPRRRSPNVTVTPIVNDAPAGIVKRPRRNDHPGGSGHGPKQRKPGHHHHHAYCGCTLRNWPRLLYGYFDSYGSRYGCDPYNYRYGTGTTYITFGTQLPFAGYGPLPCTVTGPQGWALLAAGQTAAAYEAFECLSRAVPEDGYLLIGLAMAAAALDKHDLAVTSLRTAMRVDPVSLLDVPGGDRLDVLLSKMAAHYDARARSGYGDVDALFMVAALRYLLGQDAIAHYAIEIAIMLDDVDQSTRNLKGLIEASPEDAALRRAR